MITNNKNKRWIAAFAAIVVVIMAIQTFSRISIAQDPPGKQTRDTAVFDMPPPPPPPPVPVPLFSGTDDFAESNVAFERFIQSNIRTPAAFAKQQVGTFIDVTFDDRGKILAVQQGTMPGGYPVDPGIKFIENASLTHEIIRVITKAPDFNMIQRVEGSLVQLNYMVIFKDNKWKIFPAGYISSHKMIDNPSMSKPINGWTK